MNKKRIGILTTHRQANWGSVLQCYALQCALEKHSYEVEIIDYFPEDVTLKGQLKRLKTKSKKLRNPIIYFGAVLAFTISYLKRKIVFTNYIKNNLNLTTKTYYTATDITEKDPIEDIYCCGGDQTLNGFKMLDVFNNLSKDVVKVAFSSSFGKITFSPDEWINEKKSLLRFNALSCREDSGVKIMNEMGLPDPQQIIDPVFLLSRDTWESLASNKYRDKKYIVVYNLHHDKFLENFEKELAQAYQIPIYNICNHWFEFYRYGRFLWAPPVEDFISLILHAEFVVSDSFHATAFSIIFRKKFLSIVPDLVGTRVESVLSLFEFDERIINEKDGRNYVEIIREPIDEEKIEKIINVEVQKANVFIESWKNL